MKCSHYQPPDFPNFSIVKVGLRKLWCAFFVANKHCESLKKEFEGTHKPT